MEHEKIHNLMNQLLYEELNKEDEIFLKKHLAECEECSKEFEKLNKFKTAMSGLQLRVPDDQFLSEVRNELRGAIRKERTKKTFWDDLLNNFNQLFVVNTRLVFTSVIFLLIGLGVGYLLSNKKDVFNGTQFINASKTDLLEKNNIKITNLRFIDSDAGDGEVSFSFDAVKPVVMKGKINDEMIQKILAHSLVNEQNDGVRLKTLNAISEQTSAKKYPNAKVKAALISALKYDGNPGVRRESIEVLGKLPFDEDIMEALLYVLKNDKNSGMRVAAINYLSNTKINEKNIPQDMRELLKQKSVDDENQYVRIRAKSILQEVVEQ